MVRNQKLNAVHAAGLHDAVAACRRDPDPALEKGSGSGYSKKMRSTTQLGMRKQYPSGSLRTDIKSPQQMSKSMPMLCLSSFLLRRASLQDSLHVSHLLCSYAQSGQLQVTICSGCDVQASRCSEVLVKRQSSNAHMLSALPLCSTS